MAAEVASLVASLRAMLALLQQASLSAEAASEEPPAPTPPHSHTPTLPLRHRILSLSDDCQRRMDVIAAAAAQLDAERASPPPQPTPPHTLEEYRSQRDQLVQATLVSPPLHPSLPSLLLPPPYLPWSLPPSAPISLEPPFPLSRSFPLPPLASSRPPLMISWRPLRRYEGGTRSCAGRWR